MKTAVKISQALLYLIGFFFILLSLDAFEEGNTLLENIGGFFIHSAFGFGILLFTYLLRKQYLVFGLLLLSLSIFFFFFFRMVESIYSILTIFLPIFFSGLIHLMYAKKNTE